MFFATDCEIDASTLLHKGAVTPLVSFDPQQYEHSMVQPPSSLLAGDAPTFQLVETRTTKATRAVI